LPKVTKLVALNDNNKEISDLFIRTGRIQNIIMSLLLFGFIAFGRQFITLWAGNNYSDAFIMTLLFFVSLYVPLIQNLGITILQARNQMKFRSLLYIAIASVALVLQYFFSILWGGIGCAIAVSGALFIGQGLIMNVYYYKYQKIEIFSFWKEIIKMDIAPIVVTTLTILILSNYAIDTWMKLIFVITAYLIVYCITFYYFSMNFSEKQLITKPIVNFLLHDRH
jgi:O-antigen/teichoic acid export membrane protein